jgi:hypothetical protein
MTEHLTPSLPPTVEDEGAGLPAGSPDWITPALFVDTATTWQPFYEQQLTHDEVLGILLAVGRLQHCLEHADDEAICCAC